MCGKLACQSLQARLPPLGFSPRPAAVNLCCVSNRSHDAPREMDCRLAILREQIETWKEEIDKNMSKLNQLVSNCSVKLAVWLAEHMDISLTQPLCYREREIEKVLRYKDRIVANTLGWSNLDAKNPGNLVIFVRRSTVKG